MKTIGAHEAEARFSQLLDEVERGEEIAITRDGRVVARLVAAAEPDRERVRQAIENIRKLATGKQVPTEEILAMIREGRRF